MAYYATVKKKKKEEVINVLIWKNLQNIIKWEGGKAQNKVAYIPPFALKGRERIPDDAFPIPKNSIRIYYKRQA